MANLFRISIPRGNANDTLLVADTQKSSSSCLTLSNAPDSFIVRPDRTTHEDADSNLRAYFTTLLGALHCRTNGRWQGQPLKVCLPMLQKCTSQLSVRACIAATLLAIRQQIPFSEQCVCWYSNWPALRQHGRISWPNTWHPPSVARRAPMWPISYTSKEIGRTKTSPFFNGCVAIP